MSTETLSIRISPELKDRLDLLAQQTRRSKSYLAAEAIEAYVAIESWQLEKIHKGLEDLEAGRVVSHEEVKRKALSWSKKGKAKKP